MKKLFKNILHSNENSHAAKQTLTLIIKKTATVISATILTTVLLTACKKEETKKTSIETLESNAKHAALFEGNVVDDYGFSSQITQELQQARAATARYRDIRNAIKDGYSNINVDVPNMGHHFMNTKLVDGTFDIRKPEILVYNGLDTGNPELVAVEYAVPLSNPRPEGFTGSNDVWKDDSGFPFWLLHAWVWAYNPDDAFNWTNPLIDLD
jgi:hypothetical protein